MQSYVECLYSMLFLLAWIVSLHITVAFSWIILSESEIYLVGKNQCCGAHNKMAVEKVRDTCLISPQSSSCTTLSHTSGTDKEML